MTAVMFKPIVQRNDIGMAELPDHARFLQQTADFFGGGAAADRFDRDLALQMRVAREVNAALGACAEHADDFEPAN
jgi:hypothetical protein